MIVSDKMSSAKLRDDIIGVTAVLADLKQVYVNWYFSRAEHEDPETVGPANFLAESLLRLLRHGCDIVREIREANCAKKAHDITSLCLIRLA